MSYRFGNAIVGKCRFGNTEISKLRFGTTVVYSAGSTVTYHVDTDVAYTEEVDAGDTVLTPKMFTPTKSGWIFVGWKQDATASGDVLSELTMDDGPIDLYAVFQQTISLSYNGNGNTGGTAVAAQTGNMYYNNGNTLGATFTVKSNTFAKTAYYFSRWRLNSTNGAAYSPDQSITLTANATLYAEWTYVGNPIYIVDNTVCKRALTWTITNQYNSVCYVGQQINWTVGQSYPQVNGGNKDNRYTTEITAVSGSIPTNGNRYFYFDGNGPNNYGTVTVNGRTVAHATPLDISGVASITITVYCKSNPSNSAFFQPFNMRLY